MLNQAKIKRQKRDPAPNAGGRAVRMCLALVVFLSLGQLAWVGASGMPGPDNGQSWATRPLPVSTTVPQASPDKAHRQHGAATATTTGATTTGATTTGATTTGATTTGATTKRASTESDADRDPLESEQEPVEPASSGAPGQDDTAAAQQTPEYPTWVQRGSYIEQDTEFIVVASDEQYSVGAAKSELWKSLAAAVNRKIDEALQPGAAEVIGIDVMRIRKQLLVPDREFTEVIVRPAPPVFVSEVPSGVISSY